MNDIIKMLDSHIRFGTPVTTDFLKTIRALLENIEAKSVDKPVDKQSITR